jgi:hypothetical protein
MHPLRSKQRPASVLVIVFSFVSMLKLTTSSIYSIAAIIQAQIFDDDRDPTSKRDLFNDFQLKLETDVKNIPVNEESLQQQCLEDAELRDKLLRGQLPSVSTIYHFLSYINTTARYSPPCNIVAMIYLNRVCSAQSFPLANTTWRGVWTAAIIIAQKVWEDRPLKTSSFAQLLGAEKEQLRQLELRLLLLLDYSTIVRPSVYAK